MIKRFFLALLLAPWYVLIAAVGDRAPSFDVVAVQDGFPGRMINLDHSLDGYKVLFFYPKDFTFVCPTELLGLQDRLADFVQRGVTVVGISMDDVATHNRWLRTPQHEGGIEGVSFALLADYDGRIAKKYNVFNEKDNVAKRAVFVLDKNNIIQASMVTSASVGRSIDEILRLIDALQYTEKNGHLCPVNWNKGEKGIEPSVESVAHYRVENQKE